MYPLVKRGIDILVAAVLLLLLLPLWGVVALLLWCVQGRPVLFRQPRAGKDGTPFTLLKFRTMVDAPPPHLPDRPVAKAAHDDRATPLGRILRRIHLDELPQLVNVLKGEMSLVGPRPLPIADLEQPGWLNTVDATERARRLVWLAQRHTVVPGMMGLWQISPNPEEDFDNWIRCDTDYVARQSLLFDLYITAMSPVAVFRGRQRGAK
jgi:lipopolysaccharide/colanic/teichoic acid biosynthesis glycosyltransferase